MNEREHRRGGSRDNGRFMPGKKFWKRIRVNASFSYLTPYYVCGCAGQLDISNLIRAGYDMAWIGNK